MLCRWMCHRHYQKAHCSQGCADGSAHLTPEHEASEEIDDGDLPPTEEPAPNTTVGVPVIAEGAIGTSAAPNTTVGVPVIAEGAIGISAAPNTTVGVPVIAEGAIGISAAPNTTVGVPVIAEGAAANTKPWDFLFDLEFNYGLVDQSNIISSDYQFKFDCIGPKPQHRLRYIGSFNNVH